MKTPGFLEGIVVALVAAITGEILFTVMPWFVGRWLAMLLVISLLSLCYLLYLLRRAPGKTGRVTLMILWCAAGLAAIAFEIDLSLYLLMQIGFIWLTRSCYFRSNILGALADLVLQALAFSAGLWAYSRSGNVFLTVWSFFLVEALFSLLPDTMPGRSNKTIDDGSINPRFEQAHRSALAALQRLSTR